MPSYLCCVLPCLFLVTHIRWVPLHLWLPSHLILRTVQERAPWARYQLSGLEWRKRSDCLQQYKGHIRGNGSALSNQPIIALLCSTYSLKMNDVHGSITGIVKHFPPKDTCLFYMCNYIDVTGWRNLWIPYPEWIREDRKTLPQIY